MAYSETGHNINVAHLNQLRRNNNHIQVKIQPSKKPNKTPRTPSTLHSRNQQIAFVQTSKNNYSTKVDDRRCSTKM